MYDLCRYNIVKMSTGSLVADKNEHLIGNLQDIQYNGQCHNQLLPQYFVLDKDAIQTAN